MAHHILANGIIDQAILYDLAADVVADVHPDLENRPKVFAAFTAATAALAQPHLEALVQAYRNACETRAGRDVARLFLENMLSAEG